ncbi:AMP-binding protein [Streptomyces cinereoruber]|uniref:AMP-binding protein n=1 Tax=Streptomyces cinereoruber TaxID=67260 RepID=UPI003EB7A218
MTHAPHAAPVPDAALPARPAERVELRDLPTASLRRAVSRVAEIPALRSVYAEFTGSAEFGTRSGELALTDLPVLTKPDIAEILDDLVAVARQRPHGAYVYGSGGTTSAPKLSLVPTGMFVEDILEHWSPLAPDDVLVNFNTPGRLWSSHNFFNMLAHRSGAVTIPLGSVENHELTEWLDFTERLGATAFDSTPSQIAHILEFCESTGRPAPAFRKLLWTGEGFGARARDLTRRLLPDTELYGVYGSTETWVIGLNGPGCPVDTFHVLPYQHVEIVDGVVLVTNTHPDCVNPILRYRVGDRGRLVACPCGRAEPALQVLGRDDPQLKFVSILLMPADITDVARTVDGVRDVQIALFDHGRPEERMEVRVLVDPAFAADAVEERARQRILTRVYRLGWAVASAPGSFAVRAVDRLAVNPRTQKTPLVVHPERRESTP